MSQKPAPNRVTLLLVFLLFIVVMYRLMFPTPPGAEVAAKSAVEEVNTINNRTAYEVARGGMNIVLFKAEVGNDVIYFSNQGGVWRHPKP